MLITDKLNDISV